MFLLSKRCQNLLRFNIRPLAYCPKEVLTGLRQMMGTENLVLP